MKLKVVHKLFLALALSVTSALVAMAWLAQWNLDRGFLGYINSIERRNLEKIAEQLQADYLRYGHWDWLRNNALKWRQLLDSGQERPPRRRDHNRPLPRRDDYSRDDHLRDDYSRDDYSRDNHRRPPHLRRRDDNLHFGPRVVLFDGQQQRIMGRYSFAATNPMALYADNQRVGWLGIQPLTELSESQDIDFLRQQSYRLFVFTLALIVFAAVLAVLLARNLVRPVKTLVKASHDLASGDYTTRVAVAGSDEIAALSRDFNRLAVSLDENEQARRRWIADISHELRTPLAILRGEIEALQDGVRVLDSHSLNSLHNEVLVLSKLVNDLHELSLADIGALSYQKQSFDLVKVLQQITDSFEPRLHKQQLSLQCQWPASAVGIYGDRDRLQQLFSNLLENSLRYTDPGGRIELTVTVDQQQVVITLVDSEPGVTEQECQQLFKRLYRVEASRSRTHGGSGLGLAICKNIVAAHEGMITARPATLGGLAVEIILPLELE